MFQSSREWWRIRTFKDKMDMTETFVHNWPREADLQMNYFLFCIFELWNFESEM